MGSNGLPKEVNRRQLFDVGITEERFAGNTDQGEEEAEGQEPAIACFNLKKKLLSPVGPSYWYNLHP